MSHCCKPESNCVCCNKTRVKAPWDNCLDACGKGISCPALTPDNTMISGYNPSYLYVGFNTNTTVIGPLIPGQSLNPTNMPSPAVGDITTLYYNRDGARFELRIKYPTAQTGTTATSVITSVSLINCDNGSVRTYNTGDLGLVNGGEYVQSWPSVPDEAMWRWRLYASGSAGSQAEAAWWMATVGKQIKVVFQLTGGPLRSTTVFDYCCNPANNKLCKKPVFLPKNSTIQPSPSQQSVKFRTANIVKNPGNTVYGRWSRAKYNPKTRKYTMLNGARTTY